MSVTAELQAAFERAAPWLDAALCAQDARPLYTLADVRAELDANRARLWLGRRSCVVTSIRDYPSTGEKLIEAWLAGGDWEEMRQAIPTLERWGREAGCTQAQIEGRRGWVRQLAPYGYDHYSMTVRKLLV